MSGWAPFAERIETAAKGPNRIQPRAIVNHIMQGHQSTMIRWARQRPPVDRASAHFTISRTGRVVQHVSIFEQAWHAGRLDYDRDGRLLAPSWPLWDGRDPNLTTVGIEHEGFSTPPTYGFDYVYSSVLPWPEPMVQASIRVQRWVCEAAGIAPSRDTIIGHRELAPVSRAMDPGPQWPYGRIVASLFEQRLTEEQFAAIYMGLFHPGVVPGQYASLRRRDGWKPLTVWTRGIL